MVNLIDKKGSQKKIGDQFTRLYQELKDSDLNYTWFDFHGECKKMKWENLSKLVNIVKEDLGRYGNFMAKVNYD
jgi:phosphatidylinositol 4-phosphatase